jgi:pyroglutamyl-peptidase
MKPSAPSPAPATQPVILLTGFEPFGGESSNPSALLVQSLHGLEVPQAPEPQALPAAKVHACVLPCAFGESAQALRQALDALQPRWVLALGQAGGRCDITLERVAINIDDARIPDNLGAQPIDQAVLPGAPNAYFSTLPLKAMVQALREGGTPASVSQTAGTFVCNHLFFHLLHEQTQRPSLQRAGFIHIPFLPEQASAHPGAPSMSLPTLQNALKRLLPLLLSTQADVKQSGGAEH